MSSPDVPTHPATAATTPSARIAKTAESAAAAGEGGVLVRLEEQLHVATRRVPDRRARLEKYLVTETHTVTVQLTHEQVRLVYEPVPPDERGATGEVVAAAAAEDAEPAAGQRWMTLHQQQVVVSTVVMPVERVRLEIFPVTAPQVVTEDVRREQIDTDTELIDQTDRAPVQD